MSGRESPPPEKQPVPSLKAALMIVAVIAFGMLHIAGSALLHERTGSRPIDVTEAMRDRD